MEYKTILTTYGLTKQLNCLANKLNFDLTYIAVGDGNGESYIPDENQTELKNEIWRGNVKEVGIAADGTLACTGQIPNETGNFTIREIGIFDKAKRLICIANVPPTLKTIGDSGVTDILNIKISMIIVNSKLTELIITPETSLCANVDLSNLSSKGQSIIGTVFFDITGVAPDYFDIKKLGYDYEVICVY